MTYYLAYGSNLSVEQMCRRCPGAVYIGWTWLPDHQLVFRGSGSGSYLSVDPAEGERVPCLVWCIDAAHERSLDMYEGFPGFYRKYYTGELPVYRILGPEEPICTAACMYYALPVSNPAGLPTSFYWRVCENGYMDFGFDTDFLYSALRRSVTPAKARRFLRTIADA